MGASEYFNLIQSVRLDLLELFGSGYITEHCIAAYSEKMKSKTLEIYVTDCLKCISESTAKSSGGQYMVTRFADIIAPKPKEKSGDEVAIEIIKRAGLKLKGGAA